MAWFVSKPSLTLLLTHEYQDITMLQLQIPMLLQDIYLQGLESRNLRLVTFNKI